MLDFMHKAAKVADEIMTCFAIGLDLPEKYYKEVARCVCMANLIDVPASVSEVGSEGYCQPND